MTKGIIDDWAEKQDINKYGSLLIQESKLEDLKKRIKEAIDETLNLDFKYRYYTNPKSKMMQSRCIFALEVFKQKILGDEKY